MTTSTRSAPAHGYQFRVLGTDIRSPVRAEWTTACLDAVAAGYGTFIGPEQFALEPEAEIAEV